MSQVEKIPNEEKPTCDRRHLFVCWAILLLVIAGIMNRERIFSAVQRARTDVPEVIAPRHDIPGLDDVQPKIIVGFRRLTPGQAGEVAAGSKALDAGDPIRRLRYVALVNELLGPDAALGALGALEVDLATNAVPLAEKDTALLDIVYNLLESYSEGDFTGGGLSDGDRALVEQHLRWPGKLLLHPAQPGREDSATREEMLQPAVRTALVLIGLTTWILFGGFAGLVGLFVLFLLWKNGTLQSRLGPPISHGVIYCETFILWLLCLFALTAALPRFVPALGEFGLVWSAAAMFLSLGVLVWPVVRGVPWRQVRSDIGLTWGEQPIMNVLSGVGTYFMMLPFAAVGILMFFGLLVLKSRMQAGEPRVEDYAHPIVGAIASGPPIWHVYLLAAVAAPIVEEIMFRGVFYRHLREATRCCSATVSFLLAMVINSTIFAIIHPQGLLAAPMLAGLAFGLTIAREWRGSLTACIIPHSISNFAISTLAVTLFG